MIEFGMIAFRRSVFWLVAWATTVCTGTAGAESSPLPQRQQEIQQRVRAMGRQLLVEVLDVQLQYLRENQMATGCPYDDILVMRRHVDALVDVEMPQLAELLATLETARGDDRRQTILAARAKCRQIVVALYTQRQILLKRLRIAEMAAAVRRLIEQEKAVLAATESLPRQPLARRETATLTTIEDQRDVRILYYRLLETLQDVTTWGGAIAAESAGALRQLEEHRIAGHMDDVATRLSAARFSEAATSQRAVIVGLESLLVTVASVQHGVETEAENDAAKKVIDELIHRQEELRQRTSRPDPAGEEARRLVEEQMELRRDIADAARDLPQDPPARQSMHDAETAADKAATKMFEQQRSQALAEQEAVVKHLTQAAEQLDGSSNAVPEEDTPEAMARRIADLEAAKQDVSRIRQGQKEVAAAVPSDLAEAQRRQRQIAAELSQAGQRDDLPRDIQSQLAEASNVAARAAERMRQPNSPPQQAADDARQAVDRTAAEIARSLAESRRQQMAAGVNDMAQAAAQLDRAAATSRDVARRSREASEAEGLEADEAEQLGRRQAEARETATDAAEQVRNTAPEAAQSVDQATPSLEAAEKELAAAGKQPGEPSRQGAAQAAERAEEAADHLARASEQLRQRIGQTARDMDDLAGRQIEQAEAAQQALEESVTAGPEPMGRRLEDLAEARRKVEQAAAGQLRSAGDPEAARRMELAAGIRQALQRQDRADQAARRFDRGSTASPLEAAARQREVAEAAGQLARQAAGKTSDDPSAAPDDPGQPTQPSSAAGSNDQPPSIAAGQSSPSADPLAQTLNRAEVDARQAASDLEGGQSTPAQAAQKQTRAALEQALQMAQKQPGQSPNGSADPAGQARVGQAIDEARQLAGRDAPEAAATLGKAAESSAAAEQKAAAGNSQGMAQAQQATSEQLAKASEQLDAAMGQLAGQAAAGMTQQARQAGGLADAAIPVDPEATAALQQAENRAGEAAAQGSPTPDQAGAAEKAVAGALRQAGAELDGRQRQLAAQQAQAREMGQLAGQSSAAASDALAQLAESSATPSADSGMPGPSAPSPTDGGKEPPPSADRASGDPSDGGTSSQARQNSGPATSAGASGSRQGDTQVDRLQFDRQPWFAELPPGMRSAIRANARSQPPRGYEERLRRYFESLD